MMSAIIVLLISPSFTIHLINNVTYDMIDINKTRVCPSTKVIYLYIFTVFESKPVTLHQIFIHSSNRISINVSLPVLLIISYLKLMET